MRTSDPVAQNPVVVVGAGIAGLACAFALHRRNVKVVVLERDMDANSRLQGFHYHLNQHSGLDECLQDLGMLDDVHRIRIKNDGHLIAISSQSRLWSICWSGKAEGAIGDIGRGALRKLLLSRCIDAGVDVLFGCKLQGIEAGGKAVAVEMTRHVQDETKCIVGVEVRRMQCAAVIGADGVYSKVRTIVLGDSMLQPGRDLLSNLQCAVSDIISGGVITRNRSAKQSLDYGIDEDEDADAGGSAVRRWVMSWVGKPCNRYSENTQKM
jgi:2-polyprenyl-6-methoxyphenol hydroxylase-like FAD-dependent oxidoreductase